MGWQRAGHTLATEQQMTDKTFRKKTCITVYNTWDKNWETTYTYHSVAYQTHFASYLEILNLLIQRCFNKPL